MDLTTLIAQVPDLRFTGDPAIEISSVTVDSREASRGVLFIAVLGSTADGHKFIKGAVEAGCAAIMVQAGSCSLDLLKNQYPGLPILEAQSTRRMPALVARALAGNPDETLMTAGVTGTNGKTTVSFLLQQMLQNLQGPCGLLGTIHYDTGRETIPAPLTTPNGPVFYHWLEKMKEAGCRSVAMEISSHALDQGRTAGLHLDVAIMTNLGRDHLDYHKDLPTYLAAKARIMDFLHNPGTDPAPALVLNAGDPYLVGLETGDLRVIRFVASESNTRAAGVDLQVLATNLQLTGTEVELDFEGKIVHINSPLVGRFNVENLTASLAAGIALGFDPQTVARALAHVPQVPGRLERIMLPSGALAVVDYAHTHDALAAVLGACRELGHGRLNVVFGCGGDRDKGKRPLMGAVAATDSDGVWITSDNPRSEDPARICAEIHQGFLATKGSDTIACTIIEDRKMAVEAALAEAGAGDIVVVAGKGHEDYQLVGDQVLELDDREIIRDWIGRNSNHD